MAYNFIEDYKKHIGEIKPKLAGKYIKRIEEENSCYESALLEFVEYAVWVFGGTDHINTLCNHLKIKVQNESSAQNIAAELFMKHIKILKESTK